ncbi:MAG: S41 family peptidase [Bacteroidales bacterium]
MGPAGLNEFVKYFYPQLNKKGLIIDVRGNGGGNVSPMIIERLMRRLTYSNYSTGQTEGSTESGRNACRTESYADGQVFSF